jgi:hypothetical protein
MDYHRGTLTMPLGASTFGGCYWETRPQFINKLARRDFWLWWLEKSLFASWKLRDLPLVDWNYRL